VARDFNERSDLTGDLSRLLSLIAFEKEADRRAFVRSAQAVLAARLAANREAP
jgi:hypothetical protein